MEYQKPPITIEDQINLLVSRGMDIPDRERASRYLSHISYFRLRGYWIPFETPGDGKDHHFKDSTGFDSVLELYLFDRKFRLLILEAIERVEISFRAHFANELGILYGSHFYLDTKYISNHTIHKKLMVSLKTEIERSDEIFIEHYLKTYDNPFFPPVWAAAEIMTLGQLSKWFRNIKSRTDRNRVARSYGIDQSILESFMLSDVNFKDKLLRLWTRKRLNGTFEYEWLPMTMELKKLLLWWKENCPIEREYIFVCLDNTKFCEEYYGGPFTVRQHFMRRLCEKAKVKPFGFHAIRHLTASIFYHKGYDLSVIQAILRHKSPTTTNRYLKSIGVENVRDALEHLSIGACHNSETKEEEMGFDIFGGQIKKPSWEPSTPRKASL